MGDPHAGTIPGRSEPAGDAAGTEATSLVSDVGRLFNSRLQIDEIIGLLACQVARRFAATCVVSMTDPSDGTSRLARWCSLDPQRHRQLDQALADFSGEPETAWAPLGLTRCLSAELGTAADPIGRLYVLRDENQPAFTPNEQATLEALAPQAGHAFANARLLEKERWQRQKAELMLQASKAIHTELNFDLAIRDVALLLKQAIRSPWVGLLEYQPQPHALKLMGSTAEPAVDHALAEQPIALRNWPGGQAALVESQPTAPIALPPGCILPPGAALPARSQVWAFSLLHKLVPQGLLLVAAPGGGGELSPESAEVATAVAELVALAIANQHLMEQEADARIQVIRSQAAAQEREVLLRQIVHDLRNATQAISLVAEDMELSVGDNPELQASLATINNQISFVSNFLKEKLAWIKQGQRQGQEGVSALADVFNDLEGRYGPAARAKHQRLVVSQPERVDVAVSSIELEQILGNLLDNAIKYTPMQGEIRLRGDVSDGWVTIFVSDNGRGIPAATQAHLGEVGYRGESAEEGNGLGLANVRQLVTRAGGLFGFSSHLNVGTTFHVSLPTTLWGA